MKIFIQGCSACTFSTDCTCCCLYSGNFFSRRVVFILGWRE